MRTKAIERTCYCAPCPVHETIDEQAWKNERLKAEMYRLEQLRDGAKPVAGGAAGTPDPASPKCPECGLLSDRCFIHPQPDPPAPAEAQPEAAQEWAADVARERNRIDGMEDALRAARDKFRHYAALHDAKGTPDGNSKAGANRAMADMCDDALAGYAPPPEVRSEPRWPEDESHAFARVEGNALCHLEQSSFYVCLKPENDRVHVRSEPIWKDEVPGWAKEAAQAVNVSPFPLDHELPRLIHAAYLATEGTRVAELEKERDGLVKMIPHHNVQVGFFTIHDKKSCNRCAAEARAALADTGKGE